MQDFSFHFITVRVQTISEPYFSVENDPACIELVLIEASGGNICMKLVF